jgi:hypothetical protein
MEAQSRTATPRQVALIERLTAETGMTVAGSVHDLSIGEASGVIEELLQKASSNGATDRNPTVITPKKNDFGASARLGMAFKCVYRNWVASGVNVFENRTMFIKHVLDTYELINEITEKALTG